MISKEKVFNTIPTFFHWIICFVGIWVIQEKAFAQISEGGVPPSFQFQTTLRSRAATLRIPVTFDVKDLIEADESRSAQGTPLAVAKLIDVHFNPANSGVWSTLPDGTKLWQLNLQVQGAIALILYYSDFYIPEGGKLFIYNATKSHILGAYTQRTHPSGGRFATEFVAGDELTLEYVASPDDAMPRIEIEAIGYGYNHLFIHNSSVSLRRPSDPCEVNINCEEGDIWQNQKKGVTYISQRIGGRTYLCTGSLVNNTAQDLKPYILTAQHCECDNDLVASIEDLKQWVFYFHHEREGCGSASSLTESKTITGCSKVAATTINKESDGLLLLLNMSVPENYNVYYNGWDRRNQPAQSGVSIHHPQGDYKKISTFYAPAIHDTFSGAGMIGDANAHWTVRFDETLNGHGVTENGSSGSPLFNEEKLIVGTLSGGNSTCSYPTGINLYGKIHYHWDKYTYSDTTRMDLWLDPVKSGVEVLAGRFYQSQTPNPFNLKAVVQAQTVILTWGAPSSGKPQKYNVYNNNIRIGETTSLTFTDQTPQFGTQTYSVSAVYENGNESDFISETVTVIEYRAPTDVSVSYTTTRQIAILWEMPVYEQTIYWGGNTAAYQISITRNSPYYFGQTWSRSEISPFHKRTIVAVQFVPIRNSMYEIYIVQGKRIYQQEVSNQINGQINTIQLDTPFVIDGTENLIVSMFVSTVSSGENDYHAVCDGGPAVQGKGNIYSFDGQNWSNLYDEINEPNRFNYNFFVSAVVSSVENDIPVSTNRLSGPEMTFTKTAWADKRITTLSQEVMMRSVRPTEFLEPTSYCIYRDDIKIETVPPVPRRYIDTPPIKETTYQVSALYDNEEGQRSEPVSFVPVDTVPDPTNIRIFPNNFTNQVELIGFENVSRVEVYSATGALFLRIDNPENLIRTESLHPGIYFFRIYTDNAQTRKVVRGIKLR